MSAHTRGPLTVKETVSNKADERGDHAIVDSAGKVIGEAFARVSYSDHRPALSNATLWAAAPDLLEILETLNDMARKCVACDGSGQDHRFKGDEACKQCSGVGDVLDAGCELGCIRAALKKARGES